VGHSNATKPQRESTVTLTNRQQTLSPTDVSQFIRLDQCQRYLKLRLKERHEGQGFLRDYDVAPQSIPPILTRSGARFEQEVEKDVAAAYPILKLSADQRRIRDQVNDNLVILETVAALPNGAVNVLFQPRIDAVINGWRIRGDIDILRLERADNGHLKVLVADMKSTTTAKVEHRLQVAFYHEMLSTIFAEHGIEHDPIELGILYRGPADKGLSLSVSERQMVQERGADAHRTFGVHDAFLERIEDAQSYIWAVRDLVTGDQSTARRVMAMDLDDVPYHLTYKCDGCLYNEFCMKRSAERDDLSVLPHLNEQDKRVLQRFDITTTRALASIKDLHDQALLPREDTAELCQSLAATWPVGPRIDELIHRAKRFRDWKGDDIESLRWIPNKGYGSLPYNDAEQNPNLVRIYLDAQQDYLQDRVYMLGALVVASEQGIEVPERRRSVVRMSDGPPDSNGKEEVLFVDWIEATLRALVEVAAPDGNGEPRAPIHLVFYNAYAQRTLLDGLARHSATILGATALYDFVTQIAGMDSSLVSYLDEEIRSLKNYPMTCQSLQSVAAFLKFDWNKGIPYRELFRARLFDFWGKFDVPVEENGATSWFTNRARFNSQIPLEYAYCGWDQLPAPEIGTDEFEPFRAATPELLSGFQARRLEAMEHIAHDFRGNQKTTQSTFLLPDLGEFEQKAPSLAHALDEFMTIERHVELAAWKRIRLASPEDRVLTGESLVVRYVEDDQYDGVAEQNRDNAERDMLDKQFREAYFAANPGKTKMSYTAEQRALKQWEHGETTYRLRIETADVACSLNELLQLTTFKPDTWAVLAPRIDTWNNSGETVEYTPTAKSLLYQPRVQIVKLEADREAGTALVDVMAISGGRSDSRGFVFGYGPPSPFEPDRTYTLDTDPNDRNGGNIIQVTEGLVAGGANRLYELLTTENPYPVAWPDQASAGQGRFLDGLDALMAVGAFHTLEESKRRYIAGHGTDATLLVQGPPGTGKSYSTALAVLARLQGAMTANLDYRIVLSSKTHAAIDVLLTNVDEARAMLSNVLETHSNIFERYFDHRLLQIDLARMTPKDVRDGITPLYRKRDQPKDQPGAVEHIQSPRWCVVGATPSGVFGMLKDRWPKDQFSNKFIDCVILDEASQMNLPEAMASALPLKPTGQVIVVGDHRQMPPIVKNDWSGEPRRTFKEFRAYASLFEALRERNPPMVKFEESFRLHHDMAEFLGREIYAHDGIRFHSNRTALIDAHPHADDFVAAALAPEHPLTVIVHDEARSLKRNEFEQELIRPILEALADKGAHALTAKEGLGVVVPHTSQRAGLLENIACLTEIDETTGEILATSVNTVERYQGDERSVILISSTESDREYVLQAGEFLLDPRRLTVALSRAKRKLVLVAARSIFEVFSADEEMFANAQLWKNLLRKTCTVPLWTGQRHGHTVEVWGNHSTIGNEDHAV
jgi:hypothetical protein